MKPEDARPTQVAYVCNRRVDGVEGQHFLDECRLPRGSACNLLYIETAASHRESLGVDASARGRDGRSTGDEG